MKRILNFVLITLSAGLVAMSVQAAEYEVTVTNLTPGQPLTPFLLSTHGPKFELYKLGEKASPGLAELAKDGGTGILAREIRSKVNSTKSFGGITGPGKSVSTTINADTDEVISLVSMLARTNDAFVGLKGLKLDLEVGQSQEVFISVYDAGSEVNTESCDHVPAQPCDSHGVGEDENGFIHSHPGLQNIGDLKATRDAFGAIGASVKVERKK